MVSVRAGFLLIFLLLAYPGLPGRALEPAEQQAMERAFEKKQAETSTFQSGFKQTVRLVGVRNVVVSAGRFYYAAPQSLLIKFDEPRGEYLMMKGSDLFMKKRGKEGIHRKIQPGESETGLSMLLALFPPGGGRFDLGRGARGRISDGEGHTSVHEK